MVIDILNKEFESDFPLDKWRPNKNERGYDFVSVKSNRLFISIGDSWTFGAKLKDEDDGNNPRFRIDNCFGNIVSKSLNADFLNLSIPGMSNLWMLNKYLQLIGIADLLEYERIDVFITLTEFGREIGSDLCTDPVLNNSLGEAITCREVALALGEYASQKILANLHPKMHLHLGCNYVSNIYPQSLQKFFVPCNWLEVLLGRNLDEECFVVGSWVVPKYREILLCNSKVNSMSVLKESLEMIEQGQKRLDMIYSTGFNHKEGYGHPNSAGHRKWAEYILDQTSMKP
jgi:hypothetical protein